MRKESQVGECLESAEQGTDKGDWRRGVSSQAVGKSQVQTPTRLRETRRPWPNTGNQGAALRQGGGFTSIIFHFAERRTPKQLTLPKSSPAMSVSLKILEYAFGLQSSSHTFHSFVGSFIHLSLFKEDGGGRYCARHCHGLWSCHSFVYKIYLKWPNSGVDAFELRTRSWSSRAAYGDDQPE